MARMDSRKDETQSNQSSMFGVSAKNGAVSAGRKIPAREVASRSCNSGSPTSVALAPPSSQVASRRCQSPSVRRTALSPTPSVPKRSQSAERKRPTTPTSQTSSPASTFRPSSRPSTPADEAIAAAQLSVRNRSTSRKPGGPWPAMRSLSGSFQFDCSSNSLPKRSDKPVSGSNAAQDYRFKETTEKKRAPSRGKNPSNGAENSKPADNSHPRSQEQNQFHVTSVKTMARSVDLTVSVSGPGSQLASPRGVSPGRRPSTPATPKKGPQAAINGGRSRLIASDGSGKPGKEIPLNSRERMCCRLPHSSSPRSAAVSIPTPARPSSPGFTRTAISPSSACQRKNSSRKDDEFMLRMLHNRYLQWVFVNSHADAAMIIQQKIAERILYSVRAASSGMRETVLLKGIRVQRLRLEIKLAFILECQLPYLENWAPLEKEHSYCLAGAADAMRATTLPLPLVGGTKADVDSLKDAFSSAVDTLKGMSSPVRHLLTRMEGVKSALTELTQLAREERTMLDECRKLLASTAALQVQECSLRAHLLQLRQGRSARIGR